MNIKNINFEEKTSTLISLFYQLDNIKEAA